MMLNWKLVGIVLGATALLLLVSWFLFGRGAQEPQAELQTFGTGITQTQVELEGSGTGTNIARNTQAPANAKIFKLSDGPVAGATFVQTQNPTTTIARFVMANNGRAFDLPVGVPGAVPRVLSNTTIPGVARVTWAGHTGLLQYIDKTTIKTLLLNLPPATTTAQNSPVRIQFLPNDILSLAVSPDATQVAYLLRTAQGSDGYIANIDGSTPRKIFSLPLAQLTVLWPVQGTLLVYTAPAAGVVGAALRIDTQTGAITPFITGAGLSLSASWGLDKVMYQTTGGAGGRITKLRDLDNGKDVALSFDPLPEQCVWSRFASVALCAAAATYVPQNYIDLYHQGTAGVGQQLLLYDQTTRATLIATPGSEHGGEAAEMTSLAVSPDGRYALYIKRGERSLWGVRLF